MIRLKELITEKQYNSIDSLFGELIYSNTSLPISIPIIKKLVGNIKTNKVAHVTNYKGYQKLEKLQGKKKGISSFNNLASDSKILRGYGVATGGGVIAILEGKLLINNNVDMYSRTDSQGRNWIEIGDIFFAEDHFRMPDVLPKEAMELRKRYRDAPSGQKDSAISSEEKRDYIKMYIDTATKEMLKRKKVFQQQYLKSQDLSKHGETWNEIIVAQIKIKEVAFIEDVEFSRKGLEQKVKLPKNGVIIDTNDVAGFLKKHGIKIK